MVEKGYREATIGEQIKSLTEIDQDKLIDFQIINILQCRDPEMLPFLVAILEEMMLDELDDGYVKELQEVENNIKTSDAKAKNIIMAVKKFGLLYKRRKKKIPKEVVAIFGLKEKNKPEESVEEL